MIDDVPQTLAPHEQTMPFHHTYTSRLLDLKDTRAHTLHLRRWSSLLNTRTFVSHTHTHTHARTHARTHTHTHTSRLMYNKPPSTHTLLVSTVVVISTRIHMQTALKPHTHTHTHTHMHTHNRRKECHIRRALHTNKQCHFITHTPAGCWI